METTRGRDVLTMGTGRDTPLLEVIHDVPSSWFADDSVSREARHLARR